MSELRMKGNKNDATRSRWYERASLLFLLFASCILFNDCVILSTAHAQQTNDPAPDSLCECGGAAITTTPTNAGTNFLLCFEENTDPYYHSIYSADGYLGVYLASTGNIATVTITCNRYPTLNKVIALQADQSVSLDLTGDSLDDLWIVSDESVDERVVQVHSTSPIVCYGLDYKRWSADAFCALPLEYAGTDYRVMSYGCSDGEVDGGAASGEFAVAAFENNTVVTITPTVMTSKGSSGGISEIFNLQQGECVQFQADTVGQGNSHQNLDLTGSTISSNHPVAVYGGHVMTEVPNNWIRLPYVPATRDMLLEALPPTSAWGKSFVLAPVALDSAGDMNPDGDLMRVLSLDTATVTVNGQPWARLNPGQFQDSLITSPTLVSSDKPLLVAEFAHSSYTYTGPGDPFLAIVPPMEQTYNTYTFFLPSDTNFSYQGVIVAADVSSQNNILIDGSLIPASKFRLVPGSAQGRSFSICELGLPQGVHTISSSSPPSEGFTIVGYGAGFANAYGYAAGQLLVPMRAIRIEYPPAETQKVHSNVLTFDNTAYQPAYVDSVAFTPDDPKNSGFGIHSSENVAIDIGRVDIGGSGTIHLVPTLPLIAPVSGTVSIYSHLPSYFSIEPARMHFTLYPDNSADVEEAFMLAPLATAAPNPFASFTMLNFSLPESGEITITVYDELGRVIRRVASSDFSAGPHSIRIERQGLPNGVYTCAITSEKLNFNTRIPIVACE